MLCKPKGVTTNRSQEEFIEEMTFGLGVSLFFFLTFLFYLFIYLGCSGSSLWCAGFSSCGARAACGIQFPDQGSDLDSLYWEHRVLATGPPGKSLSQVLKNELVGCLVGAGVGGGVFFPESLTFHSRIRKLIYLKCKGFNILAIL